MTPLFLPLFLLFPLVGAQGQQPALGSPQALPLGSYANATALGINNEGQIVGEVLASDGSNVGPIYWASVQAVPVALAGGSGDVVGGINDAGLMVGVDGNGAAIYWTGPAASPVALAAPGGSLYAVAVNNSGEIVGLVNSVARGVEVVEWDGVNAAPVVKASVPGPPPPNGSIAVNDAGDILVTPFHEVDSGSTGAIYFGAGTTTPVQLAQSGTRAGVDNFGNIVLGAVGTYLARFDQRALQLAGDWSFEGMNDVGQVVGFASGGSTGAERIPEIWRFMNPGAGQTVTAGVSGQAQVLLSGSASTIFQIVNTFTWSENGVVLGSGAELRVALGVGKHTIVLTAGDGPFSMSAQIEVTVQAIGLLQGVGDLIQQEQTALANEIGSVDSDADVLLSSGAKESSVDALGGQLNAVAGALAALVAPNGSLASLASGEAAIQAGVTALQKSEAAKDSAGIEQALAQDKPLVIDELPASEGGVLDQVAALAKLRVREATAAGITVGRRAAVLLAQGDTAVAGKQYEQAFHDYAQAYRQIGVGGRHDGDGGQGGHR